MMLINVDEQHKRLLINGTFFTIIVMNKVSA